MNHEEIMNIAIKEANKAYKKGEIPVGAVVTYNRKIISKAHNNRQKCTNVLGHAEIIAILKAEKKIKDWRLDQCNLYVTLKPCAMCEAVIKESRIKNVYYMLENNASNTIDKNIKYTRTSVRENYLEKFKKCFKNMR